jgi:pyruvate kinase
MNSQKGISESDLNQLACELQQLLSELMSSWVKVEQYLKHLSPSHRRSAENLIHYVALRRHDIRRLQQSLARHGLSSLGRAESHVLSSIAAVLNILLLILKKEPGGAPDLERALTFDEGRRLLRRRTEALLGPKPPQRDVRIMVTLPSEAADDYALVKELLASGMDCARINCAHDDSRAWWRMISHLRRAQEEVGRPCRICMDMAGPKLRTGPLQQGPRVVKLRPRRDAFGQVERPAQVWLAREADSQQPPCGADAHLPLPEYFLARLYAGARLEFKDVRGRARSLSVKEPQGNGWWAESVKKAYVMTGTELRLNDPICPESKPPAASRVGLLPAVEQYLILKKGDRLTLTRDQASGRAARLDEAGREVEYPRIPCTLPEIFDDLKEGERVWFDDGKIGGVIKSVGSEKVEIEITHSKPSGEKLRADKGINLPDSDLTLPSLTAKDIEDLKFIVGHADMVGYSFVRTAHDVRELQRRLTELDGRELCIILKIETRRAFEQLPDILLSAMRSPCAGVMIARGDLAVESGFERMAEVQEEIMWLCEAAHMPVIWATQVLEQLSKKGVPSRAEITDAAMSERAECVMLNKGPYVTDAVRTLNDILTRMQAHQEKKRAMLRRLRLADEFFIRHGRSFGGVLR